MPPRIVEVDSPSRLHLGMFSFGQAETRQFGGVGIMIDAPRTIVRAARSAERQVLGMQQDRVWFIVRSLESAGMLPRDAGCTIEVKQSPPSHRGLGTGTQLSLAIGTALSGLYQNEDEFQMDDQLIVRLAMATGRGRRSAVGIHGFCRGGLIVESGKFAGEAISPLLGHWHLPPAWRVVLATPLKIVGLHGLEEANAFESLPAAPRDVTAQLCRLAILDLVPAVIRGDFGGFSRAVYEYGILAGGLFAAVQAGEPFSTSESRELVNFLRNQGILGVAQSSWGPTVFALAENSAMADSICTALRDTWPAEMLDVQVTQFSEWGAQLRHLTPADIERI